MTRLFSIPARSLHFAAWLLIGTSCTACGTTGSPKPQPAELLLSTETVHVSADGEAVEIKYPTQRCEGGSCVTETRSITLGLGAICGKAERTKPDS